MVFPSGDPLRRPPQESIRYPPQETPSGDCLWRPPQETPLGESLLTQETVSGHPSGEHFVSPSGEPLVTPSGDPPQENRCLLLPNTPSGEPRLTPSGAFVDSLRRIVISKFYYLCSSSLVYRTAGWLSGLRRWKERGCENRC